MFEELDLLRTKRETLERELAEVTTQIGQTVAEAERRLAAFRQQQPARKSSHAGPRRHWSEKYPSDGWMCTRVRAVLDASPRALTTDEVTARMPSQEITGPCLGALHHRGEILARKVTSGAARWRYLYAVRESQFAGESVTEDAPAELVAQ